VTLVERRQVMRTAAVGMAGLAGGQVFGMATGESLACLQYLIGRGEAVKELRDGVAWYSACAR